MKKLFKPHHINAAHDDFNGNNGIGRYVILPGSDGRAKKIASYFENTSEKIHPRGHHLYTGTLTHEGKKIDVATISSGMGCPSMEIILHELFQLGAKRFLRVGTAGSLQPNRIQIGDFVNVQASVRDEDTTTAYVPLEVPAVASIEFISAISHSAEKLGFSKALHTGTAHCKSSLYAREFGEGPLGKQNEAYLDVLTHAGVLASEMETASLFIQSQLYNHQLMEKNDRHRVLAGAILAIIAAPPYDFSKETEKAEAAVENSVLLALETIKTLALREIGV